MSKHEKAHSKEAIEEKKTASVKKEVNEALAATKDMGEDVPADNGLNVPVTPSGKVPPKTKEKAAVAKEGEAGVDDTGKPATAFKAHQADVIIPQEESVFNRAGDSEREQLRSDLQRAARANHPEGFRGNVKSVPAVNAAAQAVADKHAKHRAKEAKAS